MNLFDDMNLDVLVQALSASDLRNKVIADNIANVNTPNYIAKGVDFESAMKEYLAQEGGAFKLASLNGSMVLNNMNSLSAVQPSIYSTGNKVNVNKEMSELAKNQIWYNAIISQGIGKMFGRLNSVLSMFQG